MENENLILQNLSISSKEEYDKKLKILIKKEREMKLGTAIWFIAIIASFIGLMNIPNFPFVMIGVFIVPFFFSLNKMSENAIKEIGDSFDKLVIKTEI